MPASGSAYDEGSAGHDSSSGFRLPFPIRDAQLVCAERPRRDAITVDLACSGADRNLRPDRSDGAIWTACWS
jgi:hypothetical protein